MKPLTCAFHQTQLIANFCRNPQCLLPVCPTCIKLHSLEHQQQKTHGIYQNIFQLHQNIKSDLQIILKNLLENSQYLKEVLIVKHQKRENICKKMKQMKIKILKNIQKYIQEIQRELLNKLGGTQASIQQDFTIINNEIQDVYNKVQKQIKLLNSDKVLKGIINHISEDKMEKYQGDIENIQEKILQLEAKDIQICREFKSSDMIATCHSIRQCYQLVFVGCIRAINPTNRKALSKISLRSSRCSDKNI